jgi:hypothetical protein
VNTSRVDVHELIAWGLDEYPSRHAATGVGLEELTLRTERAREALVQRERYVDGDALLTDETESIQHLLELSAERDALQQEFEGLDWTLGVVDLRRLLAFQRRLIFDPTRQPPTWPEQDDWHGLISLAIGTRRSTEHRLLRNNFQADGLDFTLYSNNPDFQFRLDRKRYEAGLSPLLLHGGSPFLEVGNLRGRWFLRDGYHRAYNLLRAGVHCVPAVVIFARDIEELGATKQWFFSEEQLFSDRPPRVMDFLDEAFVLRYKRMPFRKVIRVCIEESLEPFEESEEVQGDDL